MASSVVAPVRSGTVDGVIVALVAAIGAAWSVLVLADAFGLSAGLHHHALIDGGPPLPVAATEFLLAWQVMLVAMMLPASLPAIAGLFGARGSVAVSRHAPVAFLAGFSLVWSGFGLAALLGDAVLHAIVDATPWLAARPWLIEAAVIALAGAWQFAPLKRHCLEECRRGAEGASNGPFGLGVVHGVACLGASWALMLLMFAEGFEGLGWMAALAALMTYEATGRHAHRATVIAGIGLLLAALAVLSGPAGIGA